MKFFGPGFRLYKERAITLFIFIGIAVLPSLRGADTSVTINPPAPSRQPPLVTSVTDAAALPIAVATTDPNICYLLGRFDTSRGDPRCSWTASTILLKFQGTALVARMEDTGLNYWEVEIDGKAVRKMALGIGSHLYEIASGLPAGPHTIRLVRVTEAEWGPTQIHGFQLNQGGALLPAEAPAHRLEVIGDSISCGNDMEGQPNDPENIGENGYLSYGEVAARRLDLDYRCVSWSGRRMWPNKTVPSVYDKTIPTEADSKWDFSQWMPEVILINLSTNDFNLKHGLTLDEAGWTAGYEKFIGQLRSHFPRAEIYCASSPMLTGDKLVSSKAYLQKVIADLNTAGDTKVQYLEFDHEDPIDGIGIRNHPNAKTHHIMGDKLAGRLAKNLGWTMTTP